MCGISAIVQKSSSSLPPSVVERFNNSIAHRGPDGDGFEYFLRNDSQQWQVALGHRRLSIIDLSDTGKQPMSYLSGNLWITFNGEIYNYLEIKDELKSKGKLFVSTSDTEVILAAYEQWGTAAFARLRGMWSFVLYDRQQRKLIACRDRMGIKPLYYFIHCDYIAFASEIKQFFSLPHFQSSPDKAVIKQYLLTGFELTDRTFFDVIKPVKPGTFIEIEIDTLDTTNAQSFWELGNIKPIIRDTREAAEYFLHQLEESLRIHLRSDVPVGCQLSGGVDSSAVFSLMRENYTGSSIHSFTIQFPGYEKDETAFVQKMLAGNNTVSHFATPHADQFKEEIQKFIWHHDEPVGSFAHYAGFVLARLIAEHKIKVVLNGQGGDEILGGYWQQYFSYLFSLGKQGRVGSLIGHFIGAMGKEGNGELLKQVPSMFARYRSRNEKQPFSFTKDYQEEPSLHFFKDYFSASEQERRVFDIRKLILPRLLKWDDRNLMAFGVEGRYPFLDHKLIETALTFDSSVLFKNGWTKYPLRMAMKQKIPKDISFRKSKWGFETPQQNWLSLTLRPVLEEWVKSEKPLDKVIEHKDVIMLSDRYWKTGKLEDAQSLLRLFLLDQWFHVFSLRN